MAYNPYSAVNAIYKLKGQWDNANNAGDTTTKNSAAAKAQQYYKQLRNNGYGDIADQLTASNYTQAKAINDKWAKMEKTSTRDYLYSLGQSKGMSQSDVDKLISWDNQTGEVSFGGKKIGTPNAVVDGVSYWSDTSVLDNAFNDYVNRSGTAPSNTALSSQNSVGVQNKINQLWGMQTGDHSDLVGLYKQEYEDLENTNPFETEIGKSILAKYDLAGLQGRDNAVAEGAGSNGGNIDSFAAANALRQQSSLIRQGQAAALEAHQQKLDHARALLSDMGINMRDDYASMRNTIGLQQNEAQRLFENNETAKNNDVARKSEIASVTGYVPDEWVVSNNPYMNDDGTLKDKYKNLDFSVIMKNAKATGNKNLYNAAATARFYKIMDDYESFGQYDDGNYIAPGLLQTRESKEFDETMDYNYAVINSEEKIAKGENDTNLAIADKEASIAQQQINASLEAARLENEKDAYAGYNVLLSMWPTNEVEKRAFIEKHIKPLYESGTAIPPESLKQLIVANSTAYNIDVDDATKICQAYGVSTDWLSGYRDRTASDGNVTWYDGSIHKGQYGGMVKK